MAQDPFLKTGDAHTAEYLYIIAQDTKTVLNADAPTTTAEDCCY